MQGAGGGISSVGYYLSVENCTIKENYARNGAGIGIHNSSPFEKDFTLDLKNCDICNNHVTQDIMFGGGLYIRGSQSYKTTATITDCNISNNVIQCGNGAGIY